MAANTSSERLGSTSSTSYSGRCDIPSDQWADVNHPLFYYDPDFKSICFEKLNALEQLAHGWDYENAPPINRDVLQAVREFVTSLPQHIATRPMIVPLSTGNVQLEWHHGKAALELEFESPTEVHYLKWDPDHGIEEEDVIATSRHSELVDLIRWYMKERLDA